MNSWVKGIVIAGASVWLLSACEGVLPEKPSTGPAEVIEKTPAAPPGGAAGAEGSEGQGATSRPMPGSSGWQGHPLDNPDSPLSQKVVHFDFDSAAIRAEDRPSLEAHAQYLAAHPNASVILEGHADERGSREYNIGLGERRAKSVRQLLTLLGASDGQVQTISYGEERPVALGHDETAWAQNRRVRLNYGR